MSALQMLYKQIALYSVKPTTGLFQKKNYLKSLQWHKNTNCLKAWFANFSTMQVSEMDLCYECPEYKKIKLSGSTI